MAGQIVLTSGSNGTITLAPAATANAFVVTMPAETGNVITTSSTSVVAPGMLTQPLTLGTSQASTSGTSILFSGIPSWVKRITVMFSGMSTSGSSGIQVQLGTASGLVTSGYGGSCAYSGATTGGASFTTGLPLANTSGSDVRNGAVVITKITGNNWVATTVNGQSNNNYAQFGGGAINLPGTLTQLAVNMVNGSDTFDAGTINILYE